MMRMMKSLPLRAACPRDPGAQPAGRARAWTPVGPSGRGVEPGPERRGRTLTGRSRRRPGPQGRNLWIFPVLEDLDPSAWAWQGQPGNRWQPWCPACWAGGAWGPHWTAGSPEFSWGAEGTSAPSEVPEAVGTEPPQTCGSSPRPGSATEPLAAAQSESSEWLEPCCRFLVCRRP